MGRTGNSALLSADIADARVTPIEDTVEQQLVASSMVLLPIAASAILTVGTDWKLGVAAWSGEPARLIAQTELEDGAGPCLEAYRTAGPVIVNDLSLALNRWPAFAALAIEYRYRSICALPLRHHDENLGAVIMFRSEFGAMSPHDIAVGRALADVATTGIVQERTLSRAESVNQQLQTALDSRIVIEQAKGILAERGSVDMSEAFALLRSHARKTRQRLSDLARAVVAGTDTSAMFPVPR